MSEKWGETRNKPPDGGLKADHWSPSRDDPQAGALHFQSNEPLKSTATTVMSGQGWERERVPAAAKTRSLKQW